MALNIKNPEAHALASELAKLRRVTVTTAVLDAIRHELASEKNRHRKAGRAQELIEIGKRCAAHIRGPLSSADHASLLYDARGLPGSNDQG